VPYLRYFSAAIGCVLLLTGCEKKDDIDANTYGNNCAFQLISDTATGTLFYDCTMTPLPNAKVRLHIEANPHSVQGNWSVDYFDFESVTDSAGKFVIPYEFQYCAQYNLSKRSLRFERDSAFRYLGFENGVTPLPDVTFAFNDTTQLSLQLVTANAYSQQDTFYYWVHGSNYSTSGFAAGPFYDGQVIETLILPNNQTSNYFPLGASVFITWSLNDSVTNYATHHGDFYVPYCQPSGVALLTLD
jgi:hypothetical protein